MKCTYNWLLGQKIKARKPTKNCLTIIISLKRRANKKAAKCVGLLNCRFSKETKSNLIQVDQSTHTVYTIVQIIIVTSDYQIL